MDINELKLNYELIRKKKILEEEYHKTSIQLSRIQNNCKHIIVFLGHDGTDNCIGKIDERCLLCGDRCPNKVNSYPNFIDATSYKKESYGYGQNIEDRDKRFSELQQLLIDYLLENPDGLAENNIHMLQKKIKNY